MESKKRSTKCDMGLIWRKWEAPRSTVSHQNRCIHGSVALTLTDIQRSCVDDVEVPATFQGGDTRPAPREQHEEVSAKHHDNESPGMAGVYASFWRRCLIKEVEISLTMVYRVPLQHLPLLLHSSPVYPTRSCIYTYYVPRIKIGLLRRSYHVTWPSFHPEIENARSPRKCFIAARHFSYSILKCTP